MFERVKCRFGKFQGSDLEFGIGYLRVTGGEPILGEQRVRHLLKLFKLIDEDLKRSNLYKIWKIRKSPQNLTGRRNIKIQTNGIAVPRVVNLLAEKLASFDNLSLTFEVSLKGTNPQEFQTLSGGFPGSGFSEQISAINGLLDLEEQGFPLFIRGILGIFHSAQYDLVFPGEEERMMLHPSREFLEVIKRLRRMPRSQERVYVEPLRFTSHMREREKDCMNQKILADSRVGSNITPGKKISINEIYPEKTLN